METPVVMEQPVQTSLTMWYVPARQDGRETYVILVSINDLCYSSCSEQVVNDALYFTNTNKYLNKKYIFAKENLH